MKRQPAVSDLSTDSGRFRGLRAGTLAWSVGRRVGLDPDTGTSVLSYNMVARPPPTRHFGRGLGTTSPQN